MRQAIIQITSKIKELEKELEKNKRALQAFQGTCTHYEREYLGRNHNYAIYECIICKKRFYE